MATYVALNYVALSRMWAPLQLIGLARAQRISGRLMGLKEREQRGWSR